MNETMKKFVTEIKSHLGEGFDSTVGFIFSSKSVILFISQPHTRLFIINRNLVLALTLSA